MIATTSAGLGRTRLFFIDCLLWQGRFGGHPTPEPEGGQFKFPGGEVGGGTCPSPPRCVTRTNTDRCPQMLPSILRSRGAGEEARRRTVRRLAATRATACRPPLGRLTVTEKPPSRGVETGIHDTWPFFL